MKQKLWLFVVAAVGIIAACEQSTPTHVATPSTHAARVNVPIQLTGANAKSSHQLLYEQTMDLPEFGGVTPERDGHLTVYVKQALDAGVATALVATLRDRLASVSPDHAQWARWPSRIVVAPYSFADLYLTYRKLQNVEWPDGIVRTHIDVRSRTLAIGVEDAAAVEAAKLWAAAAKVPLSMITIQVVPKAVFTADVTDAIRPTPGGLWVSTLTFDPADTGSITCTIGFNVKYSGSSTKYFTTASHCGYHFYSLDNSNELYAIGGGIFAYTGREYSDPSPFTGGSCPSGKVCRWSDVAVVRYDDSVAVAFDTIVAGITSVSKLSVDGAGGDYSPYVAQGFKSGYRSGNYAPINVCVDFHPSGTPPHRTIPSNLILLCQTESDLQSREGDSGGPVGQMDYFSPSTKIGPIGTIWGKINSDSVANGLYSPIANIAADHGTLIYH